MRDDYELETPEVPISNENTEIIEVNKTNEPSEADLQQSNNISNVTSILKIPKADMYDMDLEEPVTNTVSIFAAARDFKQKQIAQNHQEKPRKSVRFLNATPKGSGEGADGKIMKCSTTLPGRLCAKHCVLFFLYLAGIMVCLIGPLNWPA